MIVIILIIEIIYYNYNYTREARDPRRKASFCVSPFPFPSHPQTNHYDNPIPIHIPSYLFHFYPLAGFCLNLMDRQTLVTS